MLQQLEEFLALGDSKLNGTEECSGQSHWSELELALQTPLA